MTTEITNELLARIYGAYFGCDTCYFDTEKQKWAIGSQNYPHALIPLMHTDDEGELKRNNTKLLLTILSDITDEDAIEVAKLILNINEDVDVQVERDKEKVHLLINTSIEWVLYTDGSGWASCVASNGLYLPTLFPSHATDYLRFKGYMILYMGIDLFTAGIAIDKKTLNIQP